MVNPLQRYQSTSILILDDFSEFRLSLKQMVQSFGTQHIDVCTNAEEALSLYSEHQHDILLVDYNLGDGLDGLQLLAELNHRNLLKYGTSYVLITGETATDLVMGALEYRPNDYLAKPFTKSVLKSRLDKLVDKTAIFHNIYAALNQNKANTALSLCDALMVSNKRVMMECMRLKSDVYLKQLNYPKALTVFNTLMMERNLSWAQMGAAICYLALTQTDKALELCQQIINKNPNAVEAYDLACECLIQQQDYEQAYIMTKKAIQRSPNSIVRQRQLAKLATRYNDYDVAFSAYKKLLKLANHSCLAQVDDYLNQLTLCTQYQLIGQGNLSRKAIKEYAGLYHALTKLYSDKQSHLIVEMHQAFISFLSHKNSDALLECANKIAQFPDPLHPPVIGLLELIASHPELNTIRTILNTSIERVKANLMTHHDLNKSEQFHRQGMMKYKEKDFKNAQTAFATALANAPNNPNIALNLLQSAHQSYVKSKQFTLTTRQLLLSAQALKQLSPKDHRFKQSQSLLNFAKAKISG